MTNEEFKEMDSTLLSTSIIILFGVLILLMQGGFLFLEIGLVRSKNATSILLKNLIDTFATTIGFSMFGYAIVTGTTGNPFIAINTKEIFLNSLSEYQTFFINVVFAATSATILSGSIAERGSLYFYTISSILLTMIIYPVCAYWAWNPKGWLAKEGFIDLAGSGIVHGAGGTAALVGCIFMGPRIGRFEDTSQVDSESLLKRGKSNSMPGHSIPLFILGSFILWIGFFPFNLSSFLIHSELIQSNQSVTLFGKTAVNIFFASVFGGMTVFIFDILKNRTIVGVSVIRIFCGILTGSVASCAGCAHIEPYAAVLTGILSGLIFIAMGYLLIFFRVDDPVSAIPVHLGGGIVGVLTTGLFANVNEQKGAFYGNPRLFGIQFAGLVCIIVWTCLFMCPVAFVAKHYGFIRVSAAAESKGLDQHLECDPCYPETYAHGDYIKFKAFLENSEYMEGFRSTKDKFNSENGKRGLNRVYASDKNRSATVLEKTISLTNASRAGNSTFTDCRSEKQQVKKSEGVSNVFQSIKIDNESSNVINEQSNCKFGVYDGSN